MSLVNICEPAVLIVAEGFEWSGACSEDLLRIHSCLYNRPLSKKRQPVGPHVVMEKVIISSQVIVIDFRKWSVSSQ